MATKRNSSEIASVSAVSADSESVGKISVKTKKDIKEQYKKAEKIKHHYFRTFYYSFAISFILLGSIAIFYFVLKQDSNFFGFADKYYNQAVEQAELNNTGKAVSLLNECLELDPGHTDARILLVNIYCASGRYDEAIDLLTEGIELSPRNETYYEMKMQILTKTDRISDAVEFINSVSSSYIIVKLSESRPSNVIMTPDPGTYDTAVAVNLASSDGSTIYFTVDGSAPTTHSSVYNAANPPVIEKGTVTIRAFAMNPNGMISDEYKATYRIYSENSAYIFFDDKIEQMVRTSINKPTGTIYYRDLQSVKRISNEEKGDVRYTGSVTTLADLTEMTNLTEVTLLNETGITDFTPLQQLKSLTSLNLSGCNITDEVSKQIFTLLWLNVLKLDDNLLSDISGIKNMSLLREFSASGNSIKDISVFGGMTVLKSLNLSNNLISDISVLSGLTSLKTLNISNNLISDISALSYLTVLTELDISTNNIKQLNSISRLPNIEILSIGNNPIQYLSSISSYDKLVSLKIDGTEITSLSDISSIYSLTSLDCSRTFVNSYSPLVNSNIKNLIASQAGITDVSMISHIKSLQILDLSLNSITDISPIANLSNLTALNVSNNPITNLSTLTACSSLENITCSGVAVSSFDESAFYAVKIKLIK